MSGGDVKLGGWGGKVWRAPTPAAQAHENRERALRELEARKIKVSLSSSAEERGRREAVLSLRSHRRKSNMRNGICVIIGSLSKG